tara:strand:- start:428 stop:871 length:444 start_codon:yes stop_codon:yes gene_type:complete
MAFALLLGFLFLDNFNGNKYAFLIIVLLTAMLPDIDHPQSKLGRKFWMISKPFNFLFGHRKLFHSLLIPVVLSFVVWWFFNDWWKPIFLGYFSHILIDGFTLDGINFIYPIKQLRLQGFIETGKKQETVLFWFFVALDVIILFNLFT